MNFVATICDEVYTENKNIRVHDVDRNINRKLYGLTAARPLRMYFEEHYIQKSLIGCVLFFLLVKFQLIIDKNKIPIQNG